MIDGLKLTMTGVQLRANLEERIGWYRREIQRLSETSPDTTQDYDGQRAHARIEQLSFIRDYIVPEETYRLGEFDLRFADLLPDEDAWGCDCLSHGAAPWHEADVHLSKRS